MIADRFGERMVKDNLYLATRWLLMLRIVWGVTVLLAIYIAWPFWIAAALLSAAYGPVVLLLGLEIADIVHRGNVTIREPLPSPRQCIAAGFLFPVTLGIPLASVSLRIWEALMEVFEQTGFRDPDRTTSTRYAILLLPELVLQPELNEMNQGLRRVGC